MPTPEATPRNDQVICPNCCHQFQAICVDDQARMRELERRLSRVAGVLQRWLDYECEPAGMTPEIVHDRAKFDAFFEQIDEKRDALVADTRAELAALKEGKHDSND